MSKVIESINQIISEVGQVDISQRLEPFADKDDKIKKAVLCTFVQRSELLNKFSVNDLAKAMNKSVLFNLNPFLDDMYFTAKGNKIQIIISYLKYISIAEANGMELLQTEYYRDKENRMLEVRVYKKDLDLPYIFQYQIDSSKSYLANTFYMNEKTAIVGAIRKSFATVFKDFYIEEEFNSKRKGTEEKEISTTKGME